MTRRGVFCFVVKNWPKSRKQGSPFYKVGLMQEKGDKAKAKGFISRLSQNIRALPVQKLAEKTGWFINRRFFFCSEYSPDRRVLPKPGLSE